MNKSEKNTLLMAIWQVVKRDGMPMNVRNGSNTESADWVEEVLDKLIKEEAPIGTIQLEEYEACPVCHSVIGNSALYCKKCGAHIREDI